MSHAPAAPASAPDSPLSREEKRGIAGWMLMDWASSVYPTLIITFVFAPYFTNFAAGGDAATDITRAEAAATWSTTIGIAGMIAAALAPLLGSIADQTGRQKPFVLFFMGLCALAAGSLWFVTPEQASIPLAMILIILGNLSFETATVFYDAMLPFIARPERIGRLSGYGFALGYASGLIALGLILVILIFPEVPPFGLDKSRSEHVRAVGIFVGAWLALFALPFALLTPDAPRTGIGYGRAIRNGFGQLSRTVRHLLLPASRSLLLFLIASAIYRDGLVTLFSQGAIYGQTLFGMTTQKVLIFGIVLNITAGIGTAFFGWLDDRIGPRRVVQIALVCLILACFGAALATSYIVFFVLGAIIGIFIGPVQAASRSYLARLVRPEEANEMFGFYALTGKATAFLGPLLYGLVTAMTQSQRWGIISIVPFFLVGLILLAYVRPAVRLEK